MVPPVDAFQTYMHTHPVSYLIDLILCGLQRLDDGLQLDLASSQALLQLVLLLL